MQIMSEQIEKLNAEQVNWPFLAPEHLFLIYVCLVILRMRLRNDSINRHLQILKLNILQSLAVVRIRHFV